MARPVSASSPQINTLSQYLPAKGFAPLASVASTQNASYPISNPPILIAVDFLNFLVQSGTTTVTFVNLPYRGTGNPLSAVQNQPQSLTINPQDLLMYEVTLQPNLVPIGCIPQVIDSSKTVHPGNFLGAGTYSLFQAVLTTSQEVSGTLVGKLYVQRGGTSSD